VRSWGPGQARECSGVWGCRKVVVQIAHSRIRGWALETALRKARNSTLWGGWQATGAIHHLIHRSASSAAPLHSQQTTPSVSAIPVRYRRCDSCTAATSPNKSMHSDFSRPEQENPAVVQKGLC
jgi:hypothetical protein